MIGSRCGDKIGRPPGTNWVLPLLAMRKYKLVTGRYRLLPIANSPEVAKRNRTSWSNGVASLSNFKFTDPNGVVADASI